MALNDEMRKMIRASREKWEQGLYLDDNESASSWWRHIGRISCSFCEEFDSKICFSGKFHIPHEESTCPLHDPKEEGCHPAWNKVHSMDWHDVTDFDVAECAEQMLYAIDKAESDWESDPEAEDKFQCLREVHVHDLDPYAEHAYNNREDGE